MINVKLLFFGATADSVGKREVEISLKDETRAEMALESILLQFPDLEENHDAKSLHFSVNQEYAKGDELIHDGDELAVFTAVSGG